MSESNDKDPVLHVYSAEYTRRWEGKRLHGSNDSRLRTKRGKPIAESKTILACDEERASDIIKTFAKKQRLPGKSPLDLGKTYIVVVNIITIKEIY